MSIWKNGELVSHSYEKTLVGARKCSFDNTIVWIEGTNMELSFNNPNPFGMVGGAINTNTGMGFTKEQLLEIASKMKEGAIMKVCGCNSLYLTKEDLRYSSNDKTVIDEFNFSNNMIKTGPNTFKPKNIKL